MKLVATILRADLIDKGNRGTEEKEEKLTECGGFWRVLMTFPSISVKITVCLCAYEIGGVEGGEGIVVLTVGIVMVYV